MALSFTIPTTAIPQNQPLQGSVALDLNVKGYAVAFVPTVWPTSGDVLKLLFESSTDGGGTWKFHSQVVYTGTAALPTNLNLFVKIPVDGVQRSLRATLTALQACTVGGTVTAS